MKKRHGLHNSGNQPSTLGDRIAQVCLLFSGKDEVAEALGVSDVQIYRYIKGENTPSVTTVVKLSHIADVSLEWLAAGSGGMLDHRLRHLPGQTINRQLLSYLIERLERLSQNQILPTEPQERASLVADIYAEAINKAPDRESLVPTASAVLDNLIRNRSSRR